MNKTVFIYPNPVCEQDAQSTFQTANLPVKRPCGAVDEEFVSDPCQQWNRKPGCAFDEVYYEPVCVTPPPPPPGPCTREISLTFTEGIGAGQVIFWEQITVGGACGAFSNLLTGNLIGPATPEQVAISLVSAMGFSAGSVVRDGAKITFIEEVVNLACFLECEPTIEIDGTGVPPYTVTFECCDGSGGGGGGGGGGGSGCPFGLQNNQAIWRFRLIDPGITYWGWSKNAPYCCDCGPGARFYNCTNLAPPAPTPFPDFTARLVATSLGPNDPGYYLSDQVIGKIQARCAANWQEFLSNLQDEFTNGTCGGAGGWWTASVINISRTTISPTIEEFEIRLNINPGLLARFPNLCVPGAQTGKPEIIFSRSWDNMLVPIYQQVLEPFCCFQEPPPPPPPPNPCVHECPDPPFLPCENGPDLLRFHFQMPDEFNLWPQPGTHGWSSTSSQWLAAVYIHSEDCCRPEEAQWIVDHVVGSFNDRKQTLQNIVINADKLPQRFYLQFAFNMGDQIVRLYTQWYEKMCCPDESVLIEADYGDDYDCDGNYYGPPEFWFGTSRLKHRLSFRIRGSFRETGFSIDRETRGKITFQVKTRKNYELITEKLPPYMHRKLMRALAAPSLKMNGVRVKFDGEVVRQNLKGKSSNFVLRLVGEECSLGTACL